MNVLPPSIEGPSDTSAREVEALDSLLRGETSAVENYDQAIAKFEDGPIALELRRIRDEHRRMSGLILDRIRSAGSTPSVGSGAWGVFASLITGAAKVLGQKTVLTALHQGEEHGITEYKKTLEDTDLSAACRTFVGTDLLPKCHQHVAALDRLIASLSSR